MRWTFARNRENLRQDSRIMACVFFFEAEDGIRDLTVTGVQTCALPISIPPGAVHEIPAADVQPDVLDGAARHTGKRQQIPRLERDGFARDSNASARLLIDRKSVV